MGIQLLDQNTINKIAAGAARNSKTGFVKMVLNFCVSQGLLMEAQSRYYPTDRFKALIENYFDEYKGRMAEIMQSLI